MAEEMLEIWDWQTGRPTGEAVPRNQAHLEGIPHEGVHLWVVRFCDNEPQVLFQKRALFKDSYPGYLDITVGGHVPFGLRNGKILKETEEEIGIRPAMDSLVDLGCFRYEEHEEKGRYHREFQHVYLLRDDRDLDRYNFNDGEVSAICAVPLDKLTRLMRENIFFKVFLYNGTATGEETLGRNNFHPLLFADSMNEYMKVVLQAAGELIDTGRVTALMPPL